jgi:type III secretory pathway component EscV/Tfp pilus assembly protein PilF
VIARLAIDDFVGIARAKVGTAEFDVAEAAFASLVTSSSSAENSFDIWNAIDREIGKAFGIAPLQTVLVELRANYISALLIRSIEDFKQACKRSPDDGWDRWVIASAEAISRFRLQFARDLCQPEYSFPHSRKDAYLKIRQGTSLMLQGRWPEAYEACHALDILAGQTELAAATKANLKVICGEINLYWFDKPDEAKAFLELAKTLVPAAPDQGRRISAWGDYLKRKRDITSAIESYQAAIDASPLLPFGYAGLGDCAQDEVRFEEAEHQYVRARRQAPGDTLAYARLLKFYGRRGELRAHEEECKRLLAEIAILNPEDEYQACCDLADLFSQDERYADANEWFGKALELDPQRPTGLIAFAASCETHAATLSDPIEKQGELDTAAQAYEKAIRNAPGCYDGYWGLTRLYEKQQNWRKALECYDKAPQWWKEWAEFARSQAAFMRWKLGEFEQAETLLKKDFSDHPDNKSALGILETVASEYFRDKKQPAEGLRLYDEILSRASDIDKPRLHRQLSAFYRDQKEFAKAESELDKARDIDRDPSADARERMLLLNAEGNEHFTEGRYEPAADLYRKAIRLSSDDPIVQSNLGAALAKLKTPEATRNAIDAYRTAQKLGPSGSFAREIGRLEFARDYGDSVLEKIENGVTPIEIELSDDLRGIVASDGANLSDELLSLIEESRRNFRNRYGIVMPGIRFRVGGDLGQRDYRILIQQMPLSSVGHIPANDAAPLTSLMAGIEAALSRNLAEFIGHQEIANLLREIDSNAPDRQHPKRLSALVSVCKGLLTEGVGLSPFERLLDEFDKRYSERGSLQNIVEQIRVLPDFRARLPGTEKGYKVFELGRTVEAELRYAVHRSGRFALLAIEPRQSHKLLKAVRKAIGDSDHSAICVATSELRPLVRLLTETAFPNLPVLSRHELHDHTAIAGLIEIDADDFDGTASLAGFSPGARRRFVTAWDDEAVEREAVPIIVFVNEAYAASLSTEGAGLARDQLLEALESQRSRMFDRQGVVVPRPEIVIDGKLPADAFRIRIDEQDHTVSQGAVDGKTIFCPPGGALLEWAFAHLIRKDAAKFQTTRVTTSTLDFLAASFPLLIESVRNRFTDKRICHLFRLLLDEGISIRDVKRLLENMLTLNGAVGVHVGLERRVVLVPHAENLSVTGGDEAAGDRLSPSHYVEFIRSSLGRYSFDKPSLPLDELRYKLEGMGDWDHRSQHTYIEPSFWNYRNSEESIPRANIVVSREPALHDTVDAAIDSFLSQTGQAVSAMEICDAPASFEFEDHVKGMSCSIRFPVTETTTLRQIHAFRLDDGIRTQLVATMSEDQFPNIKDKMLELLRSLGSGERPLSIAGDRPQQPSEMEDWEIRLQHTYVAPLSSREETDERPRTHSNIVVSRGPNSLDTVADAVAKFLGQIKGSVPNMEICDEPALLEFDDHVKGMQCSIRFPANETVLLRQIHAFRLDGDILTQIVATLSEYEVSQLLDRMAALVRGFRATSNERERSPHLEHLS